MFASREARKDGSGLGRSKARNPREKQAAAFWLKSQRVISLQREKRGKIAENYRGTQQQGNGSSSFR